MIEKRRFTIMLIILLSALLGRLFWIFKYSPDELTSDPLAYDQTAQSLIHGGGYRNVHLYAYRPPAYPYFLAAVYSIFGYSQLPVKVIQALISVCTCVIMYLLAKKINDNEFMALFVLFTSAFYPPFIKYAGELWSETLFLFFFISSILFLYREMELPSVSLNGALSGILLGLAALTREIALYFIVFIALWMVLYRPYPDKINSNFKKFTLIAFSMIVTILPWGIRNYKTFHKFIPVSTNGGINFYIGYNPQATGDFDWVLPDGIKAWPNTLKGLTPATYKKLEIETYQKAFKDGKRFIITNPARSLKLALKKAFLLWRPPYYKIAFANISGETVFRLCWLLFYSLLLISALIGMCYIWWLHEVKLFLMVFWFLLVTAMHIATYSISRYQLPLIPFLIIFSAVAFTKWFEKNFA